MVGRRRSGTTDVRPAVSCALVAMVSYGLVYRAGVDAFMGRAAGAGFVEYQEVVIVSRCQAFQRVVGGVPASDV